MFLTLVFHSQFRPLCPLRPLRSGRSGRSGVVVVEVRNIAESDYSPNEVCIGVAVSVKHRPSICAGFITVSVKKLLHYRAGGLLQYRAVLLHYRAVITLSGVFITLSGSYYSIGRLLHYRLVQLSLWQWRRSIVGALGPAILWALLVLSRYTPNSPSLG